MSERQLLCHILADEYVRMHGPLDAQAVPDPDLICRLQRRVKNETASAGDADAAIRAAEVAANRKHLHALYGAVHAMGNGEDEKFSSVKTTDGRAPRKLARSALCLSGGGIRSATFALGVLQSLARHNLLDKFDYLSTVSGGGFIGSWLSAWINREPDGTDTVVQKLAGRATDPGESSPRSGCEPAPIRHLREYSSYLSPRLGFFSADTWTLVAIYLRNLVLNWLVLIPLLAAVLIVPRIYMALLLWPSQADFGNDLPGILGCFVLGALGLGVTIFYVLMHAPSTEPPQRVADNNQRRFLWFCLLPTLLSGFMFTLCRWWTEQTALPIHDYPKITAYLRWPLGVRLASVGAIVFVLALLIFAIWEGTSEAGRDWRGERAGRRFRRVLCAAFAGAVGGQLLAAVIDHPFFQEPLNYACFALPVYLGAFLIGGVLYLGLTSRLMEDVDREWWARMGAWVLIAAISWTVLAPIVLWGPDWLTALPRTAATLGGGSALFSIFAGRSAKTPATADAARSKDPKALLLQVGLQLIAPLFILFLCAAISWGTSFTAASILSRVEKTPAFYATPDHLDSSVKIGDPRARSLLRLSPYAPAIIPFPPGFHSGSTELVPQWWIWPRTPAKPPVLPQWTGNLHRLILRATGWPIWVALAIVLAAISLVSTKFVSINKFSLSGSYRDRIIRAYLGASRKQRQPNPFTGFDTRDNIPLDQLWPARTKPSEALPGGGRPFHVLNMALNLVGGEDLAWQQRKAESFTASPLYCGSPDLGYRSSTDYFGPRPPDAKDRPVDPSIADGAHNPISLGTAVAISGAAASPNMGYHSSPALGFIMALFNVRSGWWAGNPGTAGEKTHLYPQPKAAALLLAQEALGLTDDRAKYVYLSDGGHFDNLGLYEMVLRRCRYIVVSDAGQDGSFGFEDLANAVRKIYIDMSIEITFESKIRIFPRSPAKAGGRYCAVGTIHYSKQDSQDGQPPVPNGHIIYIKPALYEEEPVDIYNYAKGSEEFPHETTANQFFTESQFESYRHLGEYIMDKLCGDDTEATFDSWEVFLKQVKCYLDPPATCPPPRRHGSGPKGGSPKDATPPPT